MLFTTISALETQLQELLEAQIQEHSFPLDRAEKVEPKSKPILVYICVPYFQVYSANKRPIQKLLLIDLLSVFLLCLVRDSRRVLMVFHWILWATKSLVINNTS